MFHEVKVFDSRGQLKKVVSSKKLSNRFWRANGSAPPDYDQGYGKAEDWNPKNHMSREKVRLDGSA